MAAKLWNCFHTRALEKVCLTCPTCTACPIGLRTDEKPGDKHVEGMCVSSHVALGSVYEILWILCKFLVDSSL